MEPQQQSPWQPPPYPDTSDARPREGTTNGWAIAALVFGLIGGILLSVIFAIVALRQIPKRGQEGKGLAIAGLVLSGLWAAALAWGFGTGYLSLDRDASGNVTEAGSESVVDIRSGDCIGKMPKEGILPSAEVVPCANPHEGQVYALFHMPAGDFPGMKDVSTAAEEGCSNRLLDVSKAAYDDVNVEIFYLHPTQLSWAQGDREIACIAHYLDGKRTDPLIKK